jgi:hypothetical protein
MKHALVFLIVEVMLVSLLSKYTEKELEFALSVKTKEWGTNQEDDMDA